MLDTQTVSDYLERISATRPNIAGLEGLRHIQESHVLTVPFENLDYHLNEEIYMDERVIDKIVHRRRGGGCYELNPALYFLLCSLGYSVQVHPGRVWVKGDLSPPLCHLVLKVRLDGTSWLVDAGFGTCSRQPLLLDSTEPQHDPHGEYQLRSASDGGTDVLLDGQPQYRVGADPCDLSDFGPTLWWYRTSPDSPFLQDMFCTIPTVDGRVTIKGQTLSRKSGGEKQKEEITDETALLRKYEELFGIELEKLPSKHSDSESSGINVVE